MSKTVAQSSGDDDRRPRLSARQGSAMLGALMSDKRLNTLQRLSDDANFTPTGSPSDFGQSRGGLQVSAVQSYGLYASVGSRYAKRLLRVIDAGLASDDASALAFTSRDSRVAELVTVLVTVLGSARALQSLAVLRPGIVTLAQQRLGEVLLKYPVLLHPAISLDRHAGTMFSAPTSLAWHLSDLGALRLPTLRDAGDSTKLLGAFATHPCVELGLTQRTVSWLGRDVTMLTRALELNKSRAGLIGSLYGLDVAMSSPEHFVSRAAIESVKDAHLSRGVEEAEGRGTLCEDHSLAPVHLPAVPEYIAFMKTQLAPTARRVRA